MALRQLLASLLLFPFLLQVSNSEKKPLYSWSRATYYGSPECSTGTASGACGYGELGRYLNGGDVSAAAPRLYRNGMGCGACYHVWCSNPQLCKEEGVKVVITDHGEADYYTDFIMTAGGYTKLARPNMAAELIAYGVIDVEYRRISCEYPGYNMMVQIKEQSSFPDYMALVIVYQGGRKDVVAVQLWQEDCKEWKAMRRAYGGVWDMVAPPKGPINIRILTHDDDGGGDGGQKWVQLTGVIPYDWKPGVTYDSSMQLL